MNKEKYLSMNSQELYKNLVADLLSDVSAGMECVEELLKSERSQTDGEFRISLETARILLFSLTGKYSPAFSQCLNLAERAIAMKMWNLVSANYNLLGNAYFVFGIYERAFEYYERVIKNESNHGLLDIKSLAYNNIGLIYSGFSEYQKACRYLELAIEVLEQAGKEQPRYWAKRLFYLSELMIAHCQNKDIVKAKEVLKHIEVISEENVTPEAIYIFRRGQMYFGFADSDWEMAKKGYYQANELIPEEDTSRKMGLLSEYILLCETMKVDYDFYRQELETVESLPESERSLANSQAYAILRRYYQFIGDSERFNKITEKYILLLETHAESIRKQQLDSLGVVDDLLKTNFDSVEDIASKNVELKEAADEAVRNKNALQEAYQQIEMIQELGQQMTSSLNLEEVTNLIYQNIKDNLPMTVFILMVADHEAKELRTITYYENDKPQAEFKVKWEEPQSTFAKCYRENRWIILSDILTKQQGSEEIVQFGEEKMNTAVFIPLSVDNKLIGVLSIQDAKRKTYSEKNILFLKQLLPYLSIALNNAVYSKVLEKEIKSHLETRGELQQANLRLELLTAMDGLTQISNRRDFDKRIVELLQQAKRQKGEIALLMIDIDHFKLYNDTYGHLEGDEALKAVAQVVRKNMDSVGGLSARFGGEEFIGACSGMNAENVRQLAEQIRQEVFELGLENRKAPLQQLTISVGAALAKEVEPEQKSEILRLADESLYQAKKTGRNKVVISVFEG